MLLNNNQLKKAFLSTKSKMEVATRKVIHTHKKIYEEVSKHQNTLVNDLFNIVLDQEDKKPYDSITEDEWNK